MEFHKLKLHSAYITTRLLLIRIRLRAGTAYDEVATGGPEQTCNVILRIVSRYTVLHFDLLTYFALQIH